MFKRLSAILLALLVVIATTGYSISAHLCGGKTVSYSLFGRPADCGEGEEGDTNDHCSHPAPLGDGSFQAQKCCTDQTVIVPGLQQVAELAKKTIVLPAYIAPVAGMVCVFRPSVFASSVKPQFADYHPPARTHDLFLLLRVFRN